MRRIARRRAPASTVGLQTQGHQDLLDHRRLQDGRHDLQLAATVRAVFQVDRKHPLEQAGPAQPHRSVMRAGHLALGGLCLLRGRRWRPFCGTLCAGGRRGGGGRRGRRGAAGDGRAAAVAGRWAGERFYRLMFTGLRHHTRRQTASRQPPAACRPVPRPQASGRAPIKPANCQTAGAASSGRR